MSQFKLSVENDNEVLRLAILGGLSEGMYQDQIAALFGGNKSWIHHHIKKFKIDWNGIKKFYLRVKSDGLVQQLNEDFLPPSQEEIRADILEELSDQDLFELFDKRIPKLSEEIKQSVFSQLREDYIKVDNELLAKDMRIEIEKSQGRRELKLLLMQAVNAFISKPIPAWVNTISSVLKDIDAEKFKQTGLQDNGDVMYRYRLPKHIQEYFKQEGQTFNNFIKYCLDQLPI